MPGVGDLPQRDRGRHNAVRPDEVTSEQTLQCSHHRSGGPGAGLRQEGQNGAGPGELPEGGAAGS